LDPNYVTRQLFNPGQSDDEMGMFEFVDPVFLRPGDTGFVSGGLPTIAFAAFTPVGGPVYNIGVNKLVRGAGLVVDEDRDDEVEEN